MMSEWEWARRSAQSLHAYYANLASEYESATRPHRREAVLQRALLRDHELTRAERCAADCAVMEETMRDLAGRQQDQLNTPAGSTTADRILDDEPSDDCPCCRGTGRHVYPSTAMGGGVGGQAMTEGPCPGTRLRPDWTDCPAVLAGRERQETDDG